MMARSVALTRFSGSAGGQESALTNPLVLISHPLYLPHYPDLARWELPSRNHPDGESYARFLRTRKAFVVGGTQFIVEMGLLPAWYRDNAVRDDARYLISSRGLRPLLQSLGDKEDYDSSLFGKSDISTYFDTLPQLRRSGAKKPKPVSRRRLRRYHPLRLRKAIEFIILTEAVLRWRFSGGNTLTRFHKFTGIRPESPDDAAFVWDLFWIEPIIYTVEPQPRKADIQRIVESESVAGRFEAETGERRGALYWLLRGVPGKFRNVEAACYACNTYYGRNVEQTAVATVPPKEFRGRLDILDDSAGREFIEDIEYVVEPGPNAIS